MHKRAREHSDRLELCLHILSTTAPYEDTSLSVALFNELHILVPDMSEDGKSALKARLERVIILAESMGSLPSSDAVILKQLSADLLEELNKKPEPKRHLIYF